jgi:hypothetical protein
MNATEIEDQQNANYHHDRSALLSIEQRLLCSQMKGVGEGGTEGATTVIGTGRWNGTAMVVGRR